MGGVIRVQAGTCGVGGTPEDMHSTGFGTVRTLAAPLGLRKGTSGRSCKVVHGYRRFCVPVRIQYAVALNHEVSLGVALYSGWVVRVHRYRTRLIVLADHVASLICPLPEKPTGPRASPPYHSRITHSPHRTALGGHQRTQSWSISYSPGRRGSLSDTGGHRTATVRDREAPGSNPGPPTNVMSHDIVDTCCKTLCTGQRPPSGW